MPMTRSGKSGPAFLIAGMALILGADARKEPQSRQRDPLILHARVREPSTAGCFHDEGEGLAVGAWADGNHRLRHVEPALVSGATRRVGELAPAMNRTIAAARAKGVLIIHAPSSCMDAYKSHPGRKRAQDAPPAANLPKEIDQWCTKIPAEEKGTYPIDQSDGGCDDGPQCPDGSPWRSQVAAIEIKDQDAISDSGIEIWNLLESRGITNVMLMGVHTNMCVLGRPFGLRNLGRSGKNVVLVRDMTDTMYNSRRWPYVSHFEGTQRIIAHIEKFVAPSILSSDLTGGPAFEFAADNRPRAVFLIGEDEYKTEVTLPAFATRELEPLGIRCTFVIANPKSPHDFPGVEALADANLLVLSVRRRAPTAAQMAIIRKYIESGKPLVGIRTACHAFDTRGKAPAGHAEWVTFDGDVLGGHYTGHHANGVNPEINAAPGDKTHIIVRDVATPFVAKGSLYKTSPLASGTQPLLMGTIPGQPAEPVAWVNTRGSSRVFYTSLGRPAISRSPRSASFCSTRSCGLSIVRRRRRNRRPPPRARDARRREQMSLLIVARARWHRARLWPNSRFPTTSGSIWRSPSRSCASRSRSALTSGGGSGWCNTLQYPYPAGSEDGQSRRRLAGGLRQGAAAATASIPRQGQDHDPRG